MSFLDKLVGNSYQKVIRKLRAKVDRISDLEAEFQKLTDKELRDKTAELKLRLAEAGGDLEREKEILEEITPEAFAIVREATKRVWNERQFDVQIIGGLVLHEGNIAEMKTGEGKTIVATLPLYLNALTGRGVHLVTVNDYLSKFNGEGMGEVYNFLGMTVGVIQSNQETYRFEKTKSYKHYSECDGSNLTPCSRKEAYACDVTYGTNNEFGFDYLRDNMAPSVEACVQRELYFAIVDEVDSILIDEARTPLIISAAAEESGSMYAQFASLVPRLSESEDYTVQEKEKSVYLTDEGIRKMEKMLGVENIYEVSGGNMVHHLEQALKAHALFKRDRDYVVREGEIIIVDEFTGRLMIGRRYSEGLHQAIEAKEGVEVKRESQTLATISFQNLFRMYKKLSGMTGTAATEAEEFFKIYTLDVVEIPTNKPIVRKDHEDKIYKTEAGKYDAVVRDVKECKEKGQPVLIGTVSVEKNELISKLLKKAGIKHEILNAKNHEREAKIITKAGLKGSITVATNMAGRGTDIKLGEGVRELGGLHVIGTERHEARRIDNQLRGRSGRQGDPGSSQFYVSLEDDLMRIFGGDRIKLMMDRLGLPEDQPIENRLISRSIESAQRKVEGYNFDIRKHLVDYDDVMNKHREVIYRKRRGILELAKNEKGSPKDEILGIVYNQIEGIINRNIDDKEKTISELKVIFGNNAKIENLSSEHLKDFAKSIYDERENRYGHEVMRQIERAIYLRTIDNLWVEHLTTMDELREGIGLRGYGQRDPLVEYKAEAYRLFEGLIAAIESSVARVIYKVEVQVQPTAPIVRRPLEYKSPDPDTIGDIEKDEPMLEEEAKRTEKRIEQSSSGGVTTTIRGPKETSVHDRMMSSAGKQHTIKSNSKVGRNDPCPCGSGKKYKKCCGR
ncbi:MAG: preprotein translocase subunit SecA [Patescibacteria group bacterium]